jgi:hypothetical protein
VQRQWVWASVSQTPLRARRLAAMARRPPGLPVGLRSAASTRKDPATRAGPADRADLDRADPAPADLDRAGPALADPAAPVHLPVDPADTEASAGLADPAARVGLRAHLPGLAALAGLVTQADLPAGLADPAARAAPRAVHGTAMPSAATSTGPRGATAPALGARVHHRGRTGAGLFLRPGVSG